MMRSTITLLLLLLSAPAFSAPLADFTALYKVSKGGLAAGEMQRSLRKESDGSYVFTSAAHSTGMAALFIKDKVREQSRLTYQDKQVKPLNYTYQKTGGKKERRLDLTFDGKSGIVTNTLPDDTWQLPVPPDAQDKLSYELALMQDLEQGKATLDYTLVDKKRLKNYHFRMLGKERLATALGQIQTIKVARETQDRVTTIWCAPSLDYLPVRLVQREKDGGELSIAVQSITGLPASQEAAGPGGTSHP